MLEAGDLGRTVALATDGGVDATHWAVSNGIVSETVAFRALADRLALPFVDDPSPAIVPDVLPNRRNFERLVRNRRLRDGCGLIAPSDEQATMWEDRLRTDPGLRERLRVTTPTASRAALTRDLERLLMDEAVDGLATRAPGASAKHLGREGGKTLAVALGVLAVLLLLPSGLWPGESGRVINTSVSLVFALFVLARLAIALETNTRARSTEIERLPPPSPDATLPFYTVLVALYREGNQVRDLVAALDALDWPRARREIVLVCEKDDAGTLDALAQLVLPPDMRVVAVPPGEPRTKPKALNFALPTCRGDIVVLYDAEDRPDPWQLREAHAAFEAALEEGGERLACVQAPLHIANSTAGPLPKLFAAEYSALFDSLLPALADRGGPVPLGGTSNHFRRAALDACGAWDGWNVTEDADLGIRLARNGWRIDTIARATREEAPAYLRPWITQRTRWFKGWMQTWLVHMRRPARLWRDLGPRAFGNFHLFVTGMLVSALVHPLLVASLVVHGGSAAWFGWAGPESAWHRALISLDAAVIAWGYLAFAIAGWRTMGLRGLVHLRPWLILVPIYWLLMSFAAWRALWQLQTAPSKWEKTPHGLS